ncbi:hypothetical protein PoB_005680500 [Plakobranchus ocellatus]|uniref:Uncharacterized protein n=1 Tax=Plakobranchus ocellatus TaxID=259542 RepID=A0AAV4CFQ0_9GAST|nr:hypothetical protein PoB_005680500 [Plakobranchus ocellatus]
MAFIQGCIGSQSLDSSKDAAGIAVKVLRACCPRLGLRRTTVCEDCIFFIHCRGVDGGTRTRDRRVPADLRADSQATVPPTLPCVGAVYKAVYRNGAPILLIILTTGLGNNMPEARNLKQKADCELAPPELKRAKMTPSQEPKLKSCLKKARRKGANKKRIEKTVRFDIPIKATITYWIFKRIHRIKRGMQSFLEKIFSTPETGLDDKGNTEGACDRAKHVPTTRFTFFQGKVGPPNSART